MLIEVWGTGPVGPDEAVPERVDRHRQETTGAEQDGTGAGAAVRRGNGLAGKTSRVGLDDPGLDHRRHREWLLGSGLLGANGRERFVELRRDRWRVWRAPQR